MKSNTFLCVILALLFSNTTAGSDQRINPPDELNIFLLIGQSNMAGVAKIGVLDTFTLRNVYLFNSESQWEQAKNTATEGINRYSTVQKKSKAKLGPGYTFARKLATYSNKKIGLISNARGGTTISWWQKGYTGENDFDLYEQAIERVNAALAISPNAKIKGIIWHQGEGDNSKVRSVKYMDNLKKLIQDLRADLGDSTITFIAGEVGKWKNRGLRVNPIIRQIKDSIQNTDWVSSDGLSSLNIEKNDPHFDTYDQRILGERYADKALELIYHISPGGVTLFTQPNFEGRSVTLQAGDYDITELESMGIEIKEIASLKVSRGYKVFLISDGVKAKHHKISQDIETLKDNRFSTLRIKSSKKN